jgi:hypothetical protein
LKKEPKAQTTLQTILEKLIEKNKDNLSSSEEITDDEEEAEANDEETTGSNEENENHSRVQTAKSQRRQSTKSINNKENPEELAQAYLDLEDKETALKYLEKYVLKLKAKLGFPWDSILIEDEQLPMMKFFHSLLLQTITSTAPSPLKTKEIPNKDTWTNLLQTYIQIFNIAVQLENSSDKIAEAHVATFQICQQLYDIPPHLITVYNLLFKGDSNNLQWKELIDLLQPDESTDILMRIAAYDVSKEDYNQPLEIYCTLQGMIQNQEIFKSAVNYGILKLFDAYIISNEKNRSNIMTIDIHSSNIPIFDRILLCRLIISFWEEMEEEKMIVQFKKELLNLQNEPGTVDDLETTNCIGKVLTKVQDNALACLYWNELRNIYNEMLPSSIVTLLYSEDSTFKQIFQATQEMNNELSDNLTSLAESYELLATYEEKDGSEEDAYKSLKLAMVIYNKFPSVKEKIAQLQTKMNALKNE